jgi:hypothetical protein
MLMLALGLGICLTLLATAGAQTPPKSDKKQPAPRQPRSDKRSDKEAAAKAADDKEAEAEFRKDLADQAASSPDLDEEEMKLRAMREKRKGPMWPGSDPAFLLLPKPTERTKMADELLTPEVRTMTKRALTYLVGKQSNSDGSWSDEEFKENTGVTALCVLAFMAEGSRPRIGVYGKQIDRGLEFILNNVQPNGVIAGKGSNPMGPGYENAMSTLALLYAYGDMPYKPEVRDVISRSIQAIARSQKLDGGWRYDFSREGQSDMSVTANVLWVLRTAKKAGFTVSADSVKKGTEFVERCAMPDGTFRYRTFGITAEPSLGGTGVIALANKGDISHPLIPRARDRIAYDYERYSVNDLKGRRFFVFGCFYASLATYMCGDSFTYKMPDGKETRPGGFIPWFKKSVQVLAAVQQRDGQFLEYDQTNQGGNCYSVWPTAMGAIVLQAPLGYLPIYER